MVQNHDGPNGSKQFLSNMKLSVWIPKAMVLLTEIEYDDGGVPMVQSSDGKKHYCIDVLQKFHSAGSNHTPAAPPLPGQAPGTPAGKQQPVQAYGSKPLPGMLATGNLALNN